MDRKGKKLATINVRTQLINKILNSEFCVNGVRLQKNVMSGLATTLIHTFKKF